MEGTIRIAGTVGESIVDGPGFRYTLFVQGCPHGCPGCHNPQTHDFDGGQDIALDTLLHDMCRNPFIKGVTFSGGEPFCKAEPLYYLAVELKSRGKHLMAYSGYTFEELMQLSDPYVKKLLGEDDGRHFCECYDITDEGNFHGKSIPNLLLNTRWNFVPEGYAEFRERLRGRQFRTKVTGEGSLPHREGRGVRVPGGKA